MYIVKYYGGSYDNHYTNDIFVTNNKQTATKYVTKFNKLLKKWKKHYEQYEEKCCGIAVLKDEYLGKHFRNWYKLNNITECYWEEIEFRTVTTRR